MHTFSRFVRPYQRSCAAFSTVPVGNQVAEYFHLSEGGRHRPVKHRSARPVRPHRYPLPGRLQRLLADFAVDRFAEEVGVAGVACCLLDEVQEYPAE